MRWYLLLVLRSQHGRRQLVTLGVENVGKSALLYRMVSDAMCAPMTNIGRGGYGVSGGHTLLSSHLTQEWSFSPRALSRMGGERSAFIYGTQLVGTCSIAA